MAIDVYMINEQGDLITKLAMNPNNYVATGAALPNIILTPPPAQMKNPRWVSKKNKWVEANPREKRFSLFG